MSQGLKRKIESAFKRYAQDKLTNDITVYESRDTDSRELPLYLFTASDLEITEGFDHSHGEYTVSLSVSTLANADDTTEEQVDSYSQAIQEMMGDISSIRTALNKPSGTDDRAVKDIYIYDIRLTSESIDTEERHWVGVETYEILCRNDNGDGS